LLAVSAQTAQVAFGALLLLAGFGLAGPMLVRPLTAPARALLSRTSGFCGHLAGRQMIRNPRRVAGAAGTLGVAVATIAIVATLAATFSSSAAQNVRRSLLASYVISTSPGMLAGLDPSLARRISRLPGVTQSAGLPCGTFSPPGGSETVCGISPASLSALVNLDVTAGQLSALRTGAIAVSARVAARLNWHVGQPVRSGYPLGASRTERITALYDYDQVAGSFLIPLPDYRRLFPPSEQADQLILVKAARGAARQVRSELTTLIATYPQATLDDQAAYSRQVSSGINLIATMMTGLLALSLLIGLIAVTTALALSVLERSREVGLLRAIGAAARQIRSIVRAEALATIITGAITGLILGMIIGWPLARAIDVYIVGGPGVPVPLLAVTIPAAIAVGYLAAAIPARRAAHLPIVTALHTE
jgi:putative ABC transport system permease protein